MAEKVKEKHGIFDKPLPVILDEIQVAATDARKAADEARTAGEMAAEQVMRRLRKVFLKMAKDISEELEEGKK
jgi:Cdc6-like AAA superfamily ATPase